jgi:hypothetical protein
VDCALVMRLDMFSARRVLLLLLLLLLLLSLSLAVLSTDVMEGGRVVVSSDGFVLRIVMGPEWSFCAAVMEERVAGARDVDDGGVGSAMMSVDADRVLVLVRVAADADADADADAAVNDLVVLEDARREKFEIMILKLLYE